MAVAIAVTRERRDGETRCAVTPETVKKFVAMGATVKVEAGTGAGSSIPDADYTAAGATVAESGAGAARMARGAGSLHCNASEEPSKKARRWSTPLCPSGPSS